MVGLERLISWLPALTCADGLIHQAPWTPSVDPGPGPKRDKINSEASQSDPGGKLVVTSWFQANRDTAVLYKYRRISAI